ncbi:hypothetical protein niasHT_033387 [Heterodera trifolii]|uniref:Uncharacterized protein n=1 Tax=Heterodera trifolii TaxID=157864 RepID=A0ABD2HYB0_9BILA
MLAFVCQLVATASQKPSKNEVTVTVEMANSTESCSNYKLEFTNNIFKKVCQVVFQVKVPSGTTLEKYWTMKPINGTSDQFELPDDVQLLPGQTFDQAGVTVSRADEEQVPKVTVLKVKSVLSTKACPNEE